MSEKTDAEPITIEFNILLFVFLAIVGVILFALSDRAKNLSLEGVIFVSAIDAVRYTVMLLIGSFFIKEFWRRLISNILPVRAIDYQEAVAIFLMLGLLFSR
jgi:hypothetical protein